jgi:hypothetical protein
MNYETNPVQRMTLREIIEDHPYCLRLIWDDGEPYGDLDEEVTVIFNMYGEIGEVRQDRYLGK